MNIQDFKKATIAEARQYIGSNGLGSLKADDEDYFFEILLSGCPDLREKIALLVRSGTDINKKDVHRHRLYFEGSSNKPVRLAVWKPNRKVINRALPLGVTPLVAAMWKPNAAVKLATILIENGADINATTDSGMSPLLCAVILQNIELVDYLIAHGARIYLQANEDFHCLAQAFAIYNLKPRNGHLKQELTNFGVTAPSAPLPKFQVLNLLIANKEIIEEEQNGWIKSAIETADITVVQWLLQQGLSANVMVQGNVKRESLLSLACRHCELDVIAFLIDQGADVNASDQEGITPLMLTGRVREIECLVKAGADINAVDGEGNPPLSRNQWWGTARSRKLIRLGANVNLANREGQTPLMLAALRGHVGTVEALLDAGAVTDAVDTSGHFATSYACRNWAYSSRHNGAKILPILIDAGVPIAPTQESALAIAMSSSNLDLTIKLLKNGLTLALTGEQVKLWTGLLSNIAKANIDLFSKGFLAKDEVALKALSKIEFEKLS